MNKIIWPLSSPSWTQEELRRSMIHVLDSGQLTMGPLVTNFEKEFASMIGTKYAIMTNSGSSANLLVANALLYHPQRPIRKYYYSEAIVPAIAWATTYAPFHQIGMTLQVVDVDPQTLNMDVEQAQKAINNKTKVIVAVNILGVPAALDQLRQLADEHNLWLVEDNCESLGSAVGGLNAGTWGDVGTFSFFYTHHLSTIEGGMVVTNNRELADIITCLRAHGWSKNLPFDSHLLLENSSQEFEGEYQFLLPGFNVRPTEFQAALGLEQLPRLEKMHNQRYLNAILFEEIFQDHPHFKPRYMSTDQCVPYGLVLTADTHEHRGQAIEAMHTIDIECRQVTGGCFTRHPSHRRYNYITKNSLPVANHVHDCGFFVGNHAYDLSEEINLLWETLKDI